MCSFLSIPRALKSALVKALVKEGIKLVDCYFNTFVGNALIMNLVHFIIMSKFNA